MKRVVVTGLGLLTSLGDSVQNTWDNLLSCKSGIKKIYAFLEIPYFQHQFIDLDQLIINGIKYNDNFIGKNMHTIRTKEIKKLNNPYKEQIPERIKQKYGHIRF